MDLCAYIIIHLAAWMMPDDINIDDSDLAAEIAAYADMREEGWL